MIGSIGLSRDENERPGRFFEILLTGFERKNPRARSSANVTHAGRADRRTRQQSKTVSGRRQPFSFQSTKNDSFFSRAQRRPDETPLRETGNQLSICRPTMVSRFARGARYTTSRRENGKKKNASPTSHRVTSPRNIEIIVALTQDVR